MEHLRILLETSSIFSLSSYILVVIISWCIYIYIYCCGYNYYMKCGLEIQSLRNFNNHAIPCHFHWQYHANIIGLPDSRMIYSSLLWMTAVKEAFMKGWCSLLSEWRGYESWQVGFGTSKINNLRPRQNGSHHTAFFKYILLNENIWILIKFLLKFVPKGPLTIFQHWFR